MRHLRLSLSGFLGILAAKGTGTITLDLEHQTGQLIALTGRNGAGKTTLVDNLHPYLTMPSRASAGGQFSFYEHISEEATKEYDFELRAVRYRQVARWRKTAKTRSGESHLLVMSDRGDWVPYASPSGLESDGKLETYQRLVEELVGPSSLYFTAIHQAQGRRPIYSATNTEAKDLMVRMLGLGEVPAIGAKAAAVAKGLATEIDAANLAIVAATNTQKGAAAAAVAQQAAGEAEQVRLQQAVTTAEARERVLLEAREAAKANLSTAEAAIARGRTIDAAIIASSQREQAAVEAARVQSSRLVAGLSQQADAVRRDMEQRKRAQLAHSAVVTKGSEIDALKRDVAEAEALIGEAQAAVPLAEAALVAAQAAVVEEHTKATRVASAGKELEARLATGKAKASELRLVADQAAVIDKVPCNGQSALVSACPLLEQARSATQSVTTLNGELERLRQAYAILKADVDAIGVPDVPTKQALVDAARKSRDAAAKRLADLQKVVGRKGELELREREIVAARGELAALAPDLSRLEAEGVRLAGELSSEAKRLSEELARIAGEHGGDRAKLVVEREALKLGNAAEDLKRIESDLAAEQRVLANARAGLTDWHGKVEVAKANLARANEALVAADTKRKALDNVVRTAETWTTLAKAFSANGIVALILDEAGPTLATLANELLVSCYGARFTVEIRTQIATATGALKEGFDVFVYDDRDGSSKSVSVMSGGERIWIEQAIVRAISIHLAQRSGREYVSLVSDETDGALDAANKRLFVQMMRKAIAIGHFGQQIFISQSPELWAMADTAIDVTTL